MILAGCRSAPPAAARAQETAGYSADQAGFRNVAGIAGIRFRLDNGARGDHRFVETTTGGCAFLDYDNDGRLDVFLIQAGPSPGSKPERRPPCALYRNRGDDGFTNVTRESGLEIDQGYAQGVAAADFDHDGWQDLYITAYGGNRLLRNDHGRFIDVTAKAGVADNARGPRWATAAAWGDYDCDGHLDLFVSHYSHWTPDNDVACRNPRNTRSYCSPDLYKPDGPSLYRNNGDGTFSDVTARSGLGGLKGRNLGVVWLDENADGRPDLFVANDLTPNFLLRNRGDGRFENVAGESGVALMDTGVPLAGMGVAVGDYDNDAREDLLVTNFSNQPKVVYRNVGSLFQNATYTSGIGTTTQKVLGWGCEFSDYDLDGFKDVIIGNGHVNDDVETYSRGVYYAEPRQLFQNRRDGTFTEDTARLGDLARPSVTRGLAVGDFDNDGDLDVLTNNHNRDAELFQNNIGNGGAWITLRLVGVTSNRDAVGAKLWARAGSLKQYAEVRAGSSYASSSDKRVCFGLGEAKRLDSLRIRWPSGLQEKFSSLAAGRFYVITEGRGIAPESRGLDRGKS